MTRIVAISSAKGGVGKTTVTANLSAALAEFGKNVVAVDGNLTTSNLGIHLGIPFYPVTLQDVLKRRAHIRDAMYYHPAGFRVIPADVSMDKIMLPRTNEMIDVFFKMTNDADFVLIDTAAGLGKECLASVEAADEMITVVTADMPSLTDALKLKKFADKYETANLGVVINKHRREKIAVSDNDIESFLGLSILGKVPYDHAIRRSLARNAPVLKYHKYARSSERFREIAAKIIGQEYRPSSFSVGRIFGWLRD